MKNNHLSPHKTPGDYQKLLYFTLGLPLGAEWWFGLGLIQSLVSAITRHVQLTFITSLGFYEIVLPLLLLLSFLLFTRHSKNMNYVLKGFLVGALVQPYFFMMYYLWVTK